MHRIKEAAENAKKELSTAESTNINLPYLAQVKGVPVHLDVTLTRAKFNELVRDLVEKTVEPVKSALQDAGIAASELGKVLLVGGSTRMPIVQQKVRELTGKEPSRNINPDECVAMGAAVLGSTLSGNITLHRLRQDLKLQVLIYLATGRRWHYEYIQKGKFRIFR